MDYKARPILFSAPMVRAIWERRKTKTRRIIKPQPTLDPSSPMPWVDDGPTPSGAGRCGHSLRPDECRFGGPGDRLWVKEAWRPRWTDELGACIEFRADGAFYKPRFPAGNDGNTRGWQFAQMCEQSDEEAERWHSSLHLRREFSRLTLEVVSVRAEQVQAITPEDARAEGFTGIEQFYALWLELNGLESWQANVWVWVVEFKVIEPCVFASLREDSAA